MVQSLRGRLQTVSRLFTILMSHAPYRSRGFGDEVVGAGAGEEGAGERGRRNARRLLLRPVPPAGRPERGHLDDARRPGLHVPPPPRPAQRVLRRAGVRGGRVGGHRVDLVRGEPPDVRPLPDSRGIGGRAPRGADRAGDPILRPATRHGISVPISRLPLATYSLSLK